MSDKKIITDGCEFQSDCIEYKDISYLKIMPICAIHELSIACRDKVNKCKYYTLYKQLKQKEQECKDLHNRTASIIYNLTGGRLSYSTYTLEGCEQAYHDQLEIDVERATKELEEKLQAKEQECEELKEQLSIAREWYANLRPHALELADTKLKLQKEVNEYKRALDEIIRFFKEDEKFARYSGRPIIFAKPTLEKIEKILKENDIKIS